MINNIHKNVQGFGLCINVDSYVIHMLYAWSFSHNTEVTIALNKNKFFLSLNTNTNLFAWGAGNCNKIERKNCIN